MGAEPRQQGREGGRAPAATRGLARKARDAKGETTRRAPGVAPAVAAAAPLPIMWLATWIWISLSFSNVIWHLMHWYVFFCLETNKNKWGGGN